MTSPDTPRTADALREAALAHYKTINECPSLFGMSAEEATRHAEWGIQVLDIALALNTDEVLDLHSTLGKDRQLPDEQLKLLLATLPFMQGHLRLLRMEFAHEALGPLPESVARAVLSQDEPVLHEGTSLTKANVVVQWRRRPL